MNLIIIGIVSVDLLKAFDSFPHDLIVAKLKSFGSNNQTADLIHDYGHKKVRLGEQFFSPSRNLSRDTQGSVLGPMTFNIFMNDLVYAVKHSTSSVYADDTQAFYANSASEKVEEVIIRDLANIDQWYQGNSMKRNTSKYQATPWERCRLNLSFIAKTLQLPLLNILKCSESQWTTK